MKRHVMISFRWALRLSLVIPWLAAVAAAKASGTDSGPVWLFGQAAVPYTFFIFFLLAVTVERSDTRVRKLMFLAPLLFAPFVGLAGLVPMLLLGPGAVTASWYIAVMSIPVGYAFIVLAFGLVAILQRLHLASRAATFKSTVGP